MIEPFEPDRTVFAADPDVPCAFAKALDGREVPYGGPEQATMTPPLAECPRRDECGCMLLFLGKGAR